MIVVSFLLMAVFTLVILAALLFAGLTLFVLVDMCYCTIRGKDANFELPDAVKRALGRN